MKLPPKTHLPSGRVVALSDARAREAARANPPSDLGLLADAMAVLSAEGVLRDARGEAVIAGDISVRDAHVLRAFLVRAGIVPEPSSEYTCENCSAPFEVAATSLWEFAPYVDGELSDPELDAPFRFGEPMEIPPIGLPGAAPMRAHTARRGRRRSTGASDARAAAPRGRDRVATEVVLQARTVEEAAPLWRMADALRGGARRAIVLTPAIVVALGIERLGDERRPRVIAEALMRAPHAAWVAFVDVYLAAAYPDRLFAIHRCVACGARNDLDVPALRELDRAPIFSASRRAPKDAFPNLDAFEAMVKRHADAVYAARGVRNIDLVVDEDVAACDDGGEPLLGAYMPGTIDASGVPHPPEVRIYYRTFRSEFEADPTFDPEAEVRETLDHEIEHHLNHLAGDDPLDDDEHDEIDREEARRVGQAETMRRGARGLAGDVIGFVRLTWPLWLVVAILTWLTSRCASSGS